MREFGITILALSLMIVLYPYGIYVAACRLRMAA